MFEREGVLGAIVRLLERTKAGHGRTLFMIGEAGLGKTTLLERGHELAGGMAVGIGRGQAIEATLPFGIVSEALAGLGGPTPLDSLPPGVRGGLDARSAYFYLALRRLQSLERPAALLLDDLQWADADSLSLVSFLTHRLAALPVALVATLRPWPREALEVARQLALRGHADLEHLAPLSEAASAALLRERVGADITSETSVRALAAAGGNPLFLEEVARRLQEGASLAHDSAGDESALLLSRIAGPGTDLHYAQAAAIFGVEFRPALVAAVAGIAPAAGEQALAALIEAGLARAGRRGWVEFAHPLFQQALYDGIPEPVREGMHDAAFRQLVAHGAEPSEAAEHVTRSMPLGDPEAIAVLQRAGRVAFAKGAVETAHQYLQAAVTLAGEGASPRLLEGLAETLLLTGEPATAISVYRRVVERAPGGEDRARVRLARALFAAGQAPDADAEFTAATALALSGSHAAAAVESLLDHSTACWIAGGVSRAVSLAARARDLAQEEDAALRRRAESNWALVTFLSGSAAGFDVAAAAAAEVAENAVVEAIDPAWGWGTLGNFMFIAEFSEAYDDAERTLEVAHRAAERLGAPMALGLLDSLRANVMIRRGRLAEAAASAERAAAMVELVPSLAGYAWVANAGARIELGDVDAAEAWCDRLEKLPQSLILRIWLPRMRGILASRRGRQAEASDRFLRAEEVASQAGLLEPCVVPWSRDAIAAHAACGRLADAERVVEWLEARSPELRCRWPAATAAFGRALLAESAGDAGAAEARYREAMAVYSAVRQPLSESRTTIFFGRFLRRTGNLREARRHLAAAADTAAAAGAAAVAQAALDELHAAGGRLRKHPVPDALTAQEQRVADLAISGLKPAQIAQHLSLSKRTVESHLARVYQKRQVSSQIELIKAAQEAAPNFQ